MKAKEKRDVDLILNLLKSTGGVCHLKNEDISEKLGIAPRTLSRRLEIMQPELILIIDEKGKKRRIYLKSAIGDSENGEVESIQISNEPRQNVKEPIKNGEVVNISASDTYIKNGEVDLYSNNTYSNLSISNTSIPDDGINKSSIPNTSINNTNSEPRQNSDSTSIDITSPKLDYENLKRILDYKISTLDFVLGSKIRGIYTLILHWFKQIHGEAADRERRMKFIQKAINTPDEKLVELYQYALSWMKAKAIYQSIGVSEDESTIIKILVEMQSKRFNGKRIHIQDIPDKLSEIRPDESLSGFLYRIMACPEVLEPKVKITEDQLFEKENGYSRQRIESINEELNKAMRDADKDCVTDVKRYLEEVERTNRHPALKHSGGWSDKKMYILLEKMSRASNSHGVLQVMKDEIAYLQATIHQLSRSERWIADRNNEIAVQKRLDEYNAWRSTTGSSQDSRSSA